MQQEFHQYPFYHIHTVDVVGGTVVVHQVQSPGDKEDAMECHADGLSVDTNRLPYEYPISNFQLQLVTGDHVRVIVGANKGQCGTILFTEEYSADIIPYDSTLQVKQSPLLIINFILTQSIIFSISLLARDTPWT